MRSSPQEKKNKNWYALITRAQHTKKVQIRLVAKGFTTYLPLKKIYRKWSDRYKIIDIPLFGNYIFVNMSIRDQLYILQTDGAARFVTFGGTLAVVNDREIENIKILLKKIPDPIIVHHVDPGFQIKIIRGPFKGLIGTVVYYKGQTRVLVSVKSVQQCIVLNIDKRDMLPLKNDSSYYQFQ